MGSKVTLMRPRRFCDERGWFMQSYHRESLRACGIVDDFVQDNHSLSVRPSTLRGLHFQAPPEAQAKLVRCVRGRILDVAVDIRSGSPTRGRWVAAELSAENGHQLYVPAGFAHGFLTLEPATEVIYKVTAFYSPQHEGGIRWDDAEIAVEWPLPAGSAPLLSPKDECLPRFAQLDSPFAYDGVPLELVTVDPG